MAGERVSAIHCSARTINVYNVLRKLTQSVIAAVRMLFAFSSTLVVSSSYTAVARNKVHDVDLEINKHAVGFREQTFCPPFLEHNALPLPSPVKPSSRISASWSGFTAV